MAMGMTPTVMASVTQPTRMVMEQEATEHLVMELVWDITTWHTEGK